MSGSISKGHHKISGFGYLTRKAKGYVLEDVLRRLQLRVAWGVLQRNRERARIYGHRCTRSREDVAKYRFKIAPKDSLEYKRFKTDIQTDYEH